MLSTIMTSTALLAASAVAQSVGSAIVVNKCTYDVYMANTPAQNGGYDVINGVLSPDDTYTQQWTELGVDGGWSLKLSKDNSFGNNILQYEYTFFNNGIIWYDLSAVDGNPWDGNWEISADDATTCSPRQAAYRYATDDAYGMQSCPSEATITVVLCSGEDQADDLVESISASGAAPASATTEAADYTSASSVVTSSAAPTITFAEENNAVSVNTEETVASTSTSVPANTEEMVASTSTSVSPTTFATMTTKAPNNVQTVVETEVVTQVYTTWRHRHGHGGRRS